MKVTIIDEKTKSTFKDLKIGDVFTIEGSLLNNNIYVKMAKIITSNENIEINCVNLNRGLYTFMPEDKLVIVPKEAAITITI